MNKKYNHIISLGKNCQIGDYLLSRGLGDWGDVFNNIGTPDLSYLIKLLNQSDCDLFSKVVKKGVNGLGMYFFYDDEYRLYSIHDILATEDFDKAIQIFRSQKNREWQRFKKKLESENVLFVRVRSEEHTSELQSH